MQISSAYRMFGSSVDNEGILCPTPFLRIEYSPDDTVVRVRANGVVPFKGRTLKVSNALSGLSIALRPDAERDGCYDVYFAHHRLTQIDLRDMR